MNLALRPMPLEPVQLSSSAVCARPARIEVLTDLDEAACHWRTLEKPENIYSPYQRYDWVRLWHEHVSRPAGQTPCLVIGLDQSGVPLFLWPLLRTRLGPLIIATSFGGKHAALNLMLWRADAARGLTADDMHAILAEVARRAPDLDLIMMSNQPESWRGVPNPFALLAHQRGTEDNFMMPLGLTGAQVVERELSSSMRSRLRNRERKLVKLPGYRYVQAVNSEDVDRLLTAFFAQKAAKLAALGLEDVFAPEGVKDFIRAGCLTGLTEGQPLIELHALEGDGECLALFSGLHDGHRYTLMFASHTASDHSRQSPGLILLQHLVMNCADRGFESFDIGPGEAHYKTLFCKQFEPIFDSILPLSPRGHAVVWPLRGLLWLKSTIKRTPILWRAASSLRAVLNRLRTPDS
jgi:CelD/BcsL family acetyltransferase involved in cellulose biosynthesis